jgi:putative hemolysin
MTASFQRGRYRVRLSESHADLEACQRLRHTCFFGCAGIDRDAHDATCQHVMIEGQAGLAACFRVFTMASGAEIDSSYTAQRYDLRPLAGYDRPILELGRVCLAGGVSDAEVMRLAWGALTGMVEDRGAGMIFGCTSFAGTDPAPYRDVFGFLADRHSGPDALRPRVMADTTVPLAGSYDPRHAVQSLPPLMRSYLNLGGWVGDHAVVDRAMNTLHVFTALEVDRVPPRRAQSLRAVRG